VRSASPRASAAISTVSPGFQPSTSLPKISCECFVFSLQMFRERSFKRAQGPFASAKLRGKGTKPADCFSHIVHLRPEMRAQALQLSSDLALGQVNDVSPFWSARFGLRRFLCLLLP
jgi:hypothetical protein